jgi:undecaprenyl diphosphate synthase
LGGPARLPRLAGHEAGTDNIRRITYTAGELGVTHLTLWAFSTENWRRPQDEIRGIMKILGDVIERETQELFLQGAQLRHIGSLDGLDPDLREAVLGAIDLTRTTSVSSSPRLQLRRPPGDDRRGQVHDRRGPRPLTRSPRSSSRASLHQGPPDPDLVIRTSGEHRMSNFLLWQAAYAELYFCPVLWPDFGPDHLREAIADYGRRERRFGNISASVPAGRE